MIAAIFDCDGTLYSAQFGRGLLKYASDNDGEKAVRAYYTALLVPYLLRKLKVISQQTYQRPLIEKLAWLVKGWDDERSQASFSWVIREYLLKTQQLEVIERMRDHQERGHTVVLLSGVFVPALEILGGHLHVDGLIGTRLESNEGYYTGRIVPPVILGEVKAREALTYFAGSSSEVDWAASYAYADSVVDQPILNLVGNPVVVCPDSRLLAIGLERGWEVIGTPKDH